MSLDIFDEGDVVKLKSGGPKMTVRSVGEDFGGTMSVFVSWFDDKMKVQQDAFPLKTVEKA
jgi:uncharacterized protein YodC (DUF2158 family)